MTILIKNLLLSKYIINNYIKCLNQKNFGIFLYLFYYG